MDILHEPPPGFEGIANAFAMAKLLPTTHRMGVTIGLARDGVLFASGRLEGYRQVNFFADHVREQGWYEHLLGGEADMHGCDMLFSHPADAPRREEDPSFIRRAPVELWPTGTHHANR
jgi:hypothetical protein